MTEDLIATARSAGAAKFVHERDGAKVTDETNLLVSVAFIERFAALVDADAVARTREECAKVCDQVSRLAAKDWKARYDPHDQGREFGADECESAIRALGERT